MCIVIYKFKMIKKYTWQAENIGDDVEMKSEGVIMDH